MAKNMIRRAWPRGGIRTSLPVTIYRRSSDEFSPTEISGLALWLDASDGATLFQDSAATTPATATSDPVGAWLDKSGNARHATQSSSGSRPTISATLTNGKRALAFNGTSSTLAIANYAGESGVSGLTRYMVMSQPTAAGFLTGTGGSGGNFFQQVSFEGRFFSGSAYRSVSMPLYSYLNAGTRILCSVYSGSAATVSDGIQPYGDGALLPQLATNGTLPTTLSGSASTYFLGSNLNANNFFNGRTLEVLTYNRELTSTERRRVEQYLATKYGITLAPQVSNADAQDWINRVYVNGGTVSTATATAVNQLCDSLDAALLRDRFYRLNLFCGSNLNAALVPLYRGPSLGGTQYGNATDTNLGSPAFLVGDYNETGSSGGLKGNGSSKYLNTGFPTNTLSASDRHLAAYPITWPNGGYQYFLGSESAAGASQQQFALGHFDNANKGEFAFGANAGAAYLSSTTAISSGGMWIGVNTSGSGTVYRNGVADGTRSITAATPTASEIFVFGVNRASTPAAANYFNGCIGGYSIGLSMTAPQAAAYNTAMQSFQAALTRNV